MRTHGLLISALALASSCTLIFPLDERDDGTSTTTSSASGVGSTGASTTVSVSSQSGAGTGGGANGGGGQSSAGGGGSGGRGGSGGEGGCDPQPSFDEDPNNCGECGRVCGDRLGGEPATCELGYCELVDVVRTAGELPNDLVVVGNDAERHVYFFSSSEVAHSLVGKSVTTTSPPTYVRTVPHPRLGGVAVTSSGVVAALEIAGEGGGDVGDFFAFSDAGAPVSTTPLAELATYHIAFAQVGGLEAILRTDWEGGRLLASLKNQETGDYDGEIELTTGDVFPDYVAAWELAVAGDAVYSTQLRSPGALVRWRNFTVTQIAAGESVVAIATDETHVYWADCLTGMVRRTPHDVAGTGEPEDIWQSDRHPIALALEPGGGDIYVADTSDASRCTDYLAPSAEAEARLFAVSLATGEPRLFTRTGGAISRLATAAGDDYVYVQLWHAGAFGGRIARIHR